MASSSSSVSWMPAPGRHVVNIGSSLGKALKAKKLKASPAATTTTKRSTLPERDFYSFRFNFKPTSIDTTKPASIDIQKGADNTKVTAEYPTQTGEALIFLGQEQPAKEVDCVLIYDEDTGTYSLEKLDSFVSLHLDQKTTVSRRPSPTPKAVPPTQKTTKGKGKQPQVMDDLERELLGLDEDAEGDLDISMTPASKPIACKEEEEEEAYKPLKPPSPVPSTAQPPLPPKARPMKPIPKSRMEAREPAAVSRPPRQKPAQPLPSAVPVTPVPIPSTSAPIRTKQRPIQIKGQVEHKEPVQQTELIPKKESAQKTESVQKKEPIQKKKKAKPVPVPPLPTAPPKSAAYVDEDSFGRPAKRPRPSTPQQNLPPPTPPAPVTLSLPGGSSTFAPPPLPSGSHNSRSTGSSSRSVLPPPAVPASLSLPTSTPASPPMMGQYESDEEEDWDEVSTVNPASASASLPPSNSNTNVDDNAVAYELALEQEIFGDNVFEEVDGDEEGQVITTTQQYVDGDGEEEEIDVSAFEQELNEHMKVAEAEDDSDDDVFGGLAAESEPDLQDGTRQPISMNRLASGGAGMDMSEDDYSSSDDSDDD